MEEFVTWKKKILQEVNNKIISLKYRINVHKTNSVLKQGTVIEYLNELNKKYAIVLTGMSANNVPIICKKDNVTVIF